MKKYLIIGAVAAVLVGIIAWQRHQIKERDAEIERQELHLTALYDEGRAFETENGKLAQEVATISQERDELERYNADLVAQAKAAGVKLRELEQAVEASSRTEIKTVVKTVTVRDTIGETRRAIWSDPWTDIHVESRPDSTSIEYSNRDTLHVFTWVKQKKFLFFRIGKPKPKTTITWGNRCTEMQIRYATTVE